MVAGSRPGARSPLDGERRLISATTDRPGAARAARKGRTGPAPSAARSSSASGRESDAAERRWAATIRSSTDVTGTFIHSSHQRGTMAPVENASAGTIVVVEDDRNIADLVELYLREE